MDKRVSIPVTAPRRSPTVAYWQHPPDEIADLRSTSQIPTAADIVIIGSGITGASIAYNVLTQAPETKILLLEARQACSGATGRNGGHTKPAAYFTFPANVASVGLEEAVKIAKLEYDTMKKIHAFAEEHNIPCDNRQLETVDIIYDQQMWDDMVKSIELMKESMPGDPASQYTIWSSKEADEKFLCPGAIGAITYDAGSLSAYKFVIGVLKMCLKKGLNLQTNTPVTQVSKSGGNWTVKTDRGSVHASKVIMATNAYTAALDPKFQGVIVPLRGQITAQRPGLNMPKAGLSRTYSFAYGNGFDYMIPRPPGTKYEGDIVIGGGLSKAKEEGLYQYGTVDDTVCDPDISRHLTASTPRYFGKNWGENDPAGQVRMEWSGIMGYTADGHPFIGEMPNEPGLYVSAAFQGHGMVFCFSCAQALTSMLFEEDEAALFKWFPKSFKVTSERLKQRFTEPVTREFKTLGTKSHL